MCQLKLERECKLNTANNKLASVFFIIDQLTGAGGRGSQS
jgi:hypothetical protein